MSESLLAGQIERVGLKEVFSAVAQANPLGFSVLRIVSKDASGSVGIYNGRYVIGARCTTTHQVATVALQELLACRTGMYALVSGSAAIGDQEQLQQGLFIDLLQIETWLSDNTSGGGDEQSFRNYSSSQAYDPNELTALVSQVSGKHPVISRAEKVLSKHTITNRRSFKWEMIFSALTCLTLLWMAVTTGSDSDNFHRQLRLLFSGTFGRQDIDKSAVEELALPRSVVTNKTADTLKAQAMASLHLHKYEQAYIACNKAVGLVPVTQALPLIKLRAYAYARMKGKPISDDFARQATKVNW